MEWSMVLVFSIMVLAAAGLCAAACGAGLGAAGTAGVAGACARGADGAGGTGGIGAPGAWSVLRLILKVVFSSLFS